MRYFILILVLSAFNCVKDNSTKDSHIQTVGDKVYDESGCLYTSYKNLLMAGYQGWFTAGGDGSDRGWHHYEKSGKFEPGFSTIDFWPDVTDYSKIYKTAFKYSDGSNAYVYSPYDEETVDLHFKWMKEYGIDGVFMQRFISEIKSVKGRQHFNKVLANALKAANKYDRAICVMYDLSGSRSADMQILLDDWNEIREQFSLFDNIKNPTYLRHNKKPLIAIWGVGFKDGRNYSLIDVKVLLDSIKGSTNKVSVMLGVPYYWRTFTRDTENNPLLHELIRDADIIMPWAVGRYNNESYSKIAPGTIAGDIEWCNTNNVDYVPLVFPGFSWGNLKNDPNLYNQIPRLGGDFLWEQVAGARKSDAEALYVAMFDEIDEGTAIFKCAKEGNLPLNGEGSFVGIEDSLESDYYLWLTGQAANWFHGANDYTILKPLRK